MRSTSSGSKRTSADHCCSVEFPAGAYRRYREITTVKQTQVDTLVNLTWSERGGSVADRNIKEISTSGEISRPRGAAAHWRTLFAASACATVDMQYRLSTHAVPLLY